MTLQATAPWADVPAGGPMLRPSEAAAYLGYRARQTLYERVKAGDVPAPIHLHTGSRATGIPKPWLDAVIAARIAGSKAA